MKYAIGVDIGGTNTRVALINDQYDLVKRESFITNPHDPHSTLERINEAIKSFDEDFVGIGVSCPGPLSAIEGKILSPPNLLGWHQFKIVEELRNLSNSEVFLENDANLAALGEAIAGAGRGYSHVQFLTVSTGVGGGFIHKGQIYTGSKGFAQEIANIIFLPDGPALNNLIPGSLESISSGTAITKSAQDQGLEVHHAGDVNQLAINGNLAAQEIMEQAKDILSNAIACSYAFLDPDLVILGGGVALNTTNFIHDIQEKVKNKVYDIQIENINIVRAKLDDNSGLIGAAIYAFEHVNKLGGETLCQL